MADSVDVSSAVFHPESLAGFSQAPRGQPLPRLIKLLPLIPLVLASHTASPVSVWEGAAHGVDPRSQS